MPPAPPTPLPSRWTPRNETLHPESGAGRSTGAEISRKVGGATHQNLVCTPTVGQKEANHLRSQPTKMKFLPPHPHCCRPVCRPATTRCTPNPGMVPKTTAKAAAPPTHDLVCTAKVGQKPASPPAAANHRNWAPPAPLTPLPPRWPPCNEALLPNPGPDGRSQTQPPKLHRLLEDGGGEWRLIFEF